MIPTDSMLNRAMAEVCGWTFHKRTATPPNGGAYAMVHPYTEDELEPWPDYCKDRNALEEIWAAVEKSDEEKDCYAVQDFEHQIAVFANCMVHCDIMSFLKVPPRLHVIAALKTLDRWEPEWEIGEDVGKGN